MNLRKHNTYFLVADDEEFEFRSFDDVLTNISQKLIADHGRISLSAVDGKRPAWQRFIFGVKNYVVQYFSMEWIGDISGLIVNGHLD